MASPINANNVVLVTMVGTAVVVIGSDLKEGKGIRGTHLLGLGLVYASLAALNDFAPKLAIPFSVLVLVGVLLYRGPGIIDAFGNVGTSSANLTDVAKGTANVQTQNTSGHVQPPRQPRRSSPSVVTIPYSYSP